MGSSVTLDSRANRLEQWDRLPITPYHNIRREATYLFGIPTTVADITCYQQYRIMSLHNYLIIY